MSWQILVWIFVAVCVMGWVFNNRRLRAWGTTLDLTEEQKHWFVGVAVVIGLVVALWVTWTMWSLPAITVASVAAFAASQAVWIAVIGILTYFLVELTPEPWKKSLQPMILVLGGLLLIMGGISWLASDKSATSSRGASIPLASAPQSEWPKLPMPPRGKSAFVSHPSDMQGMRFKVSGEKFVTHYVYLNDEECIHGQKCPDGAQVGFYVTNESDAPNTVRYAYFRVED